MQRECGAPVGEPLGRGTPDEKQSPPLSVCVKKILSLLVAQVRLFEDAAGRLHNGHSTACWEFRHGASCELEHVASCLAAFVGPQIFDSLQQLADGWAYRWRQQPHAIASALCSEEDLCEQVQIAVQAQEIPGELRAFLLELLQRHEPVLAYLQQQMASLRLCGSAAPREPAM